jgi:hypothetical protein
LRAGEEGGKEEGAAALEKACESGARRTKSVRRRRLQEMGERGGLGYYAYLHERERLVVGWWAD